MKSLFKAVSVLCFVSIFTLNPAQASSSTLSNAIAASMFAQSGETPLSAEKAKLVIQALQAELSKKDLVCKVSSGQNGSESYVNFDNLLEEKDLVVTIATNHSQPILTISKVYNESGNTTVATVTLTTSADFKALTGGHVLIEKVVTQSVNVGDLINPVFENKDVRTPIIVADCNLRN